MFDEEAIPKFLDTDVPYMVNIIGMVCITVLLNTCKIFFDLV